MGLHKANSTSFRKGQKYLLNGERMGRKKGCIPWNKGIHQWEGKINPNTGKKRPEISINKKKYWEEWRAKNLITVVCPACGKILKKNPSHFKSGKRKTYCSYSCASKSRDPDMIRKIAEKAAITNRERGHYEETRKRMLNGLASKARRMARFSRPSKPQLKMYELLLKIYPTAELEVPVKTFRTTRFIDVGIVSTKLGFEYDGQYWHKNAEFDMMRQIELENEGWTIMRFKSVNEVENYVSNMTKSYVGGM
jgi:very-short-patch-repair endonuclease